MTDFPLNLAACICSFFFRFSHFYKASITEEQEYRPLRAQRYVILSSKGRLTADGLEVSTYQVAFRQVSYPVFVLREENLGVEIKNCRMVKHKFAPGIFSYDHGEDFKRTYGRSVLDDKGNIDGPDHLMRR